MKESCQIMRDLFVPYLDDTCSADTRALLEQHCAQCAACQQELTAMQQSSPDVPVANEQAKAKRPFRRIKRRMRWLLVGICALLLLVTPVAVYLGIGCSKGFYRADQLFFGLKTTDFYYADQATVDNLVHTLYRFMYRALQEKAGANDKMESFAELTAMEETIRTLTLDISRMTDDSDWDGTGQMTFTIPLITPWDDTPTVAELTGSRIGIGRYAINRILLHRQNVTQDGYVYLDFVGQLFEQYEPWPYSATTQYIVSAFRRYQPQTDQMPETDETWTARDDLSIRPGRYQSVDDAGNRIEMVFYDDGTLTYDDQTPVVDDAFPGTYPMVLSQMWDTAKPRQYFIVQDSEGHLYLAIRYQVGVRKLGGLKLTEDGNYSVRNDSFVRVDA